MNNVIFAVHGLHFCIALTALWVLNSCWRTYRLDVFRQFVFDVRDQLFDLAVEHDWLEKQSYRSLRMHLNASIRYAHKTSLLHLILFQVASSDTPLANANPWAALFKEVESEENRRELDVLHQRFNMLLTDKLLSGIFPLFLLFKAAQYYRQFYGSLVNTEQFEARSYEVETVEHRRQDRLIA